ncbi:MAG: hypothetical protein CME71_07715 [Halobacteriovorax sp.]|nr:hypothetical protein [Halobacteriovorax sp.]
MEQRFQDEPPYRHPVTLFISSTILLRVDLLLDQRQLLLAMEKLVVQFQMEEGLNGHRLLREGLTFILHLQLEEVEMFQGWVPFQVGENLEHR